MKFSDPINQKVKADQNSGFGTNSNSYGGRFINKDGKANVEKVGMPIFGGISWYHTMIEMSTWKFMTIILLFYIGINFVFASIYYLIGVDHLDGIISTDSPLIQFGQAYFFSAQTFTTVGYGHISPTGFLTSALSAAEALMGLLSFAIATGLFFGRFSKPTAFLKFSDNAIIAPYKDGKAFMVRLSPFKNTNFTDAEAQMTLGMRIEENGILVNKFYQLELELEKISALTLSWTLVHPITENSPLCSFSKKDYKETHGEVLVFIKTFDDMFSATVATRSSYTFDEVVYGAKFVPMYTRSTDNSKTILNLDKLSQLETVVLK
ncbi:ion channel [Flavobacterium crassostreae]|uniref:Inward rectifier potassium channel Irk n=1 Tax=Flavobacterium crassostreae TaxID=1763534 RepID=A0A1B9E838_9FLAO|nr:ion channel [Flavobacterium crassostreae]OCB78114.1 Inward rectifier potassium channel Irk [Flavobacterium crassostreae]